MSQFDALYGNAAAAGDRPQHVSQFPKPPDYYLHFANDGGNKSLIPPPPPPPLPFGSGETYATFGQSYVVDEECIVRSLEAQNIRRLYPFNFDRKTELRKLLFSVLANYMDLLDILVHCPRSQKRRDKLEDINLLFINMQHLINELRPHQAREALLQLLEKQKIERIQVAERFTDEMQKALESLSTSLQEFPATDDQYIKSLSTQLNSTKEALEQYKLKHTRLILSDDALQIPVLSAENSAGPPLMTLCADLDKDADDIVT